MKKTILFFAAIFLPWQLAMANIDPNLGSTFYSSGGREREVSFKALFRTDAATIEQIKKWDDNQKFLFKRDQMEPTLKFLFGPLTNRSIGGPQRGLWLTVNWDAIQEAQGKVLIPYEYRGVWIVDKDLSAPIEIPVPFNQWDLYTEGWQKCTDSNPEHQTESFFWYFWDPSRFGCSHQEGVQFQIVKVQFDLETQNQKESYPEYQKLFQSSGVENRFELTFAFGYVQDPANPDPANDFDAGAMEYRSFIGYVQRKLGASFQEEPILRSEYLSSRYSKKEIGRRFIGKIQDKDIVVNIVIAAGVDQMELFAKSFAHDHDGFFGWFGHSRVGSGFDADKFWQMLIRNNSYYSVSEKYQMVYWGGCNSYSYYTLPFFEFKSHVANGIDPNGTKGLDIIANGLPSYFMLNADNAAIVLNHLLSWNKRASYQIIVNELEARANREGIDVLVAVLGDEDNQ